MNRHILKTLQKLQLSPHTDGKLLSDLIKHVEEVKNPIKSSDIIDHFCSMFLPYDRRLGEIFLVHHIKADDWIPPGGHIEAKESPLDTVKREIIEELNFEITKEHVELFDISLKYIERNKRFGKCLIHRDFWYLIHMNKTDFTIDPGEFYDAQWFTLDHALKKIKTPEFVQVIRKLAQYHLGTLA